MIAFVEGNVRLIRPESIVIDVHGFGCEVFVPHPQQYVQDAWQFLYTYMQVREDALTLFGFDTQEDYEVFVSLITVRGIGPKMALKALAKVPGVQILEAINSGDLKTLKSLPGVGPKLAGQIILDLKGKVVMAQEAKASIPANPVWAETREALLSLGYKPMELEALEKEMAANTSDTVDVMLRKSLQFMARRNGV